MKQSSRITAYVDGSQTLYRAEYGFPARIISRTGHAHHGPVRVPRTDERKALHGCPITLTHAVVVFDADAPVARSITRRRPIQSRPSAADGGQP